jgi:uncharacterized protein (DUF2461 family)
MLLCDKARQSRVGIGPLSPDMMHTFSMHSSPFRLSRVNGTFQKIVSADTCVARDRRPVNRHSKSRISWPTSRASA